MPYSSTIISLWETRLTGNSWFSDWREGEGISFLPQVHGIATCQCECGVVVIWSSDKRRMRYQLNPDIAEGIIAFSAHSWRTNSKQKSFFFSLFLGVSRVFENCFPYHFSIPVFRYIFSATITTTTFSGEPPCKLWSGAKRRIVVTRILPLNQNGVNRPEQRVPSSGRIDFPVAISLAEDGQQEARAKRDGVEEASGR